MHEERIGVEDQPRQHVDPDLQVWALGEVLAELLAQYQAHYPDLKVVLVETPAGVAP